MQKQKFAYQHGIKKNMSGLQFGTSVGSLELVAA